ncbi:hypothetical protein IQ06DRAFT_337876 [Phaeosphaeriaceae sp. SRC1lsM3a]|nr:hypothetical protein IQ06DRAFT_337876 [Stagonospora sp. SRC1lsM3a]
MFSYAVGHASLLLLCQALAAPQRQGGLTSPTPLPPISQTVLRDCPTWPGSSGITFEPGTCVQYNSVRAGGAVAQVYGEVTTHGTDVDTATKNRLGSLKKTLSEVLSFYATNLDQNLNVRLTVVREDRLWRKRNPDGSTEDIKPYGLTDADPTTGTPCNVAIWIWPSRSNKLLAHTIAHELYHCVQRMSSPQTVHGWVEEGSAMFMEYFQYTWDPTKAEDDIAPHHYNPSEPLYGLANRYTSSLFFMFRHNLKFTLRNIEKWVQTRVATPADGELAALANDQLLADAFARFAVKFHNKGIRYDSAKGKKKKTLVTTNPVITAADVKIDLPAEGATGEQEITMESWTFQKYKIQLVPGQTVSAAADWTHDSGKPEPKVVIWRRVVRQGKSPSAWSKFRPGSLQSGCSKTTTWYEFLVVPVTEEARVEGYLRFTRQKDAKCACPVRGPGSGPTKRSISRPDLVARQEGNVTRIPSSATSTSALLDTQLTVLKPLPQPTLPPNTPPSVESNDGQDWPEGDTDDSWRDSDSGTGGEDEGQVEEEDIDETGSTDNEEPPCDESAPSGPSCLIGTWKANKASMDAHLAKPEYRYHPSNEINSTFTGSLTFTFGLDPTASTTSMKLPLIDKLIEEQLLVMKSATTGPPEVTFFTAITSILDVLAWVSVDANGFRPLGPESGSLRRNVTASTGVYELSSGRGETPSVTQFDGKRVRPQGLTFDYNCTATTLYYTYFTSSVKSYVFDRV